jgi:hypothetical protein
MASFQRAIRIRLCPIWNEIGQRNFGKSQKNITRVLPQIGKPREQSLGLALFGQGSAR